MQVIAKYDNSEDIYVELFLEMYNLLNRGLDKTIWIFDIQKLWKTLFGTLYQNNVYDKIIGNLIGYIFV